MPGGGPGGGPMPGGGPGGGIGGGGAGGPSASGPFPVIALIRSYIIPCALSGFLALSSEIQLIIKPPNDDLAPGLAKLAEPLGTKLGFAALGPFFLRPGDSKAPRAGETNAILEYLSPLSAYDLSRARGARVTYRSVRSHPTWEKCILLNLCW